MHPSVVTTSPVSEAVRQALEISLRGAQELLPQDAWVGKLVRSEASGQPLRIKLGLDPTAPDIHIGHTVVLNKLRQLQDLGHQVIFLIGDFTGLIGDPSGRNDTRPPLTPGQIRANAETYYRQASLVLDPARTEIRYNSEWSEPLGAAGMIQLAAKYTVARMMERDDFHKRFASGQSISVHEFLYPLMQGYDSVALKSDLELGGTDQKFNLLMGRHLQQEYGQEPQCVLTMPLLVGTDGVEKMSKSKNNYIGIAEDANTMYAKVLSISDPLMWNWYQLLSFRSLTEIQALQAEVAQGRNPKDAKVLLAKEITTRFHSAAAADAAEQDFMHRSRGGVPEQIPQLSLPGAPLGIGALLKQANLAPSTSEAQRLIDGGGVRIDGSVVSDKGLRLGAGTYVLQVGKRRFARVVLT
ncbi:tyrosine--tRNA ligase [Verminephrobacter aporrectodeae subsp. tuberculatae]|uniref:tyrosine--tRNA ligase n=2 Tax=Verminephrobacter aporrectodeae TaxID=1110389 RepID=UPI0022374088|nr:tyrosine--tRNA ligase [Verminephrobacter aporrectodeae]MCW5220247.1 tyrosine--tRNA ligase [Verminephrobacter aporrectodeae subsp. tuberculatae]MCW5289540.1 tyrosine--tRNA ligase [Verminephrobacter aporrectodeae subsp. tuberculatae]MCW8165500.1 tyrosine--tRNA ligase [Verminephrobacter aporrectodeae subsp. tuberculatae]MCW8170496.1 tyrosine--tRNA ligase [Verminephrobacter aporrectodeae subsp. tuberculatae]